MKRTPEQIAAEMIDRVENPHRSLDIDEIIEAIRRIRSHGEKPDRVLVDAKWLTRERLPVLLQMCEQAGTTLDIIPVRKPVVKHYGFTGQDFGKLLQTSLG